MANIAVVEDDPSVLEFLCDALDVRGHEVWPFSTFETAKAGLLGAGFLDRQIDLLVTDVDLPDGSGLDLVRLLKQAQCEFPVLVESGRTLETDLLLGFDAGASDYITKPVSVSELLAKCAVLLARAQAKRQSDSGLGGDLPGGLQRAFGRYRISGVIGTGGGGSVFSAWDLEEERPVALKVLPSLAGLRPGARQRFVREVYTLSSVHHPGVVRVLDFGGQEGRSYFAMEMLEGLTLEERIEREGVLSEPSLLALLLGMAKALAAVHEAGLVHRDLKPSNIMLLAGDCAQPKLIDFGVAKRPDDHSVTQLGALVGTPAFFSPEQVRGQRLDARSDLFTLGLVAHYALTGACFHREESLPRLLSEISSRPLVIPAAEASPGLRELLHRLTRIDREERFASAAELVEALEGLEIRGETLCRR